MEYCKFHVAAESKTEEDKPAKTDEEVSTWDKDFVKVDQATLFELILVSLACNIPYLCNAQPGYQLLKHITLLLDLSHTLRPGGRWTVYPIKMRD